MDVLGIRGGAFADSHGTGQIREVCLAADMAWPQARVGALCEAVVEWQHVVLGRLSHEPILQIAQLLRLRICEVVRLREVLLTILGGDLDRGTEQCSTYRQRVLQ